MVKLISTEGRFVQRLTLLAKGNLDVRDSLHSCRIGGKLVWNGINEVLRAKHPGWLARVQHETWTRSDALLEANGQIPEALHNRDLPLGAYSATTQFSTALFETSADAIILSVQPDICTALVRHRKTGFLFYPGERLGWNAPDREWLESEFDALGYLACEDSMRNLAAVVTRLRDKTESPILIYNLSPIIPGESIHCYQGLGEVLSTRIRRFNVGLIELSEELGISIVDVDSTLARGGAESLKLDSLHLTPEGIRRVAEEVVRVLEETGLVDQ